MTVPDLAVEGARVAAELDALSRFGDAPAPAVTRILFTGASSQSCLT